MIANIAPIKLIIAFIPILREGRFLVSSQDSRRWRIAPKWAWTDVQQKLMEFFYVEGGAEGVFGQGSELHDFKVSYGVGKVYGGLLKKWHPVYSAGNGLSSPVNLPI